jgi:hypothetical protein
LSQTALTTGCPKGHFFAAQSATKRRPLYGSLRELCTRYERGSRDGLQSDGVQERVEVGDDSLIQPVESMAFLLREAGIGGDGGE